MAPAESQGEAEMGERREEDVEVAEEPADAPMVDEGEDDKSAKPPEDTTDNAKMEEDKVEPAAKEQENKVDMDEGHIDKDSEEKKEEEVKLEGAKVEEKEDTSGGTEQELQMDEKRKEPEYSKELEEDAPADERAKLAEGAAKINTVDTTLNVLTCYNGKILTALSDGGFQHLFAAARGTVGLKQGRYLFEVRVVESRNPTETSPPNQGKGHAPPRQLFRLGFTAAGSSLFLSDTADGVGFDSEGNFLQERSRTRVSQRLTPSHQVFGVLLNLDEQSPNANTVSLFRDGVRVCPPQSIPDNLKGKALFPTVNYKNMALHVNFGPTQLAALPFTCRMLQNAAEEDVEVAATASPDGKCEVVFPVGLPDEGTFDWLDSYMKEHHGYTELSDRAVLEWAQRSGLWRPRGYMHRVCNDRPGMEFGIKEMDDLTIRRMMHAIAPTLRRNYVVMEVRNNLLAGERKKALAHFESSEFRKVALVVMGEPPEEHKTLVQSLMLNDKRQRAASEVKRRKHFEERKGADDYDKEPEDKNGDTKDEENKEKYEAKEEAEKEVDGDGAPVEQTIELTEEEKKLWFRKGIVEDLTKKELGHSFSTFTIPDKDEGFDEIKFVWQAPDSCTKYLNHWIFEHKLTQRVEDLQPGSWFREKYSEWTKLVQDWKSRQSAWKEQGNKGQHFKRKEPTEKEEKDVDNGEGETKPDEENTEQMKQDTAAEDLDVFSVEDVNDIGNGEPMYGNFTYEDWTLLSLRFELHLLVHAFKVDMNDPERTSFREGHLAFYYNAYYKKSFNVKFYGCSTVIGLLDMIKDTLEVGPNMSLLDPQLADDTPFSNFVKLTEDHRRRRQRRVDMGDETATLKFQRPSPRTQSQTYGQPQMTRGNNSGYASRAPPPVPQGRGGTYPRGRDGPPGSRTTPSGPLSRYGSNTDTRGSSGGYGASNYRGSGGGGPPQRYGYNSNNNSNNPVPAPPPARSYAGQYSYGSSSSGAQKRSYQPPSGGGSYPPYKQQRTSSYTAPPTGRSSYPSYGDSGRGSGTGGGYSSSYRR